MAPSKSYFEAYFEPHQKLVHFTDENFEATLLKEGWK
jgi:hypothetical protein